MDQSFSCYRSRNKKRLPIHIITYFWWLIQHNTLQLATIISTVNFFFGKYKLKFPTIGNLPLNMGVVVSEFYWLMAG